jgi:hypothetical protein
MTARARRVTSGAGRAAAARPRPTDKKEPPWTRSDRA